MTVATVWATVWAAVPGYAAMMLIGIGIDLLIGWPDSVFRRIGHPVTWIGALIGGLERRFNREGPRRRAKGIIVALTVIACVTAVAGISQCALPDGPVGIIVGGVLAWPLIAMRSLRDHVARVATPLEAGDISGARMAVSMIVGRDPNVLDEAGIARAAIESLAENASDGVVAPLFWGVVFGLPGIAAYKAINTLDSMIGHRNARYEQFGWAGARIDDVVNLIPARLTGVLFALVSHQPIVALRCMWRDAGQHRSPNAGWPEAAMAGALGVRVSGPRVYGDRIAQEPWVNEGAPDPTGRDVFRALGLYWWAMGLLAALIGGIALI